RAELVVADVPRSFPLHPDPSRLRCIPRARSSDACPSFSICRPHMTSGAASPVRPVGRAGASMSSWTEERRLVRIVFCSDPLRPSVVDETYKAEAAAAEQLGVPCELV